MYSQTLKPQRQNPQIRERESFSRAFLSRTIVPGLLFALLVTGACYRAPEVSGDDQVHNLNIEATALKDGHFESMSWEAIDDLMTTQFVDDPEDEPGCAVGVVRDGEIVYLQGYGYSRMPVQHGDAGERWGVGTMGAVGSISKTITAAAVLQMHERNFLNVNRTVGQHLTTSNNALGNTGVWRLLNHTAGVGGASRQDAFEPNWNDPSFVSQCGDGTIPALDCGLVSQYISRPLAAFTQYDSTETVVNLVGSTNGLDQSVYSNVGYSVAGAVVDRAAHNHTTSDGYEAYVWDEIANYSGNLFEPGHMLSMALTHSWRDTDIPHRAVGYVANGGGFSKWEAWQGTGTLEGWEGPSGGWTMTIGDLSRFMIALDEASFFESGHMREAMRLEWSNIDDFDDHYGMGMFLGEGGAGAPDYWHGGAIGGQSLGVISHNAVWAWWEDYEGKEIGVAMMCNRSDAGVTGLKRQTDEIAEIVRYGNPDPPSQIAFAKIGQAIPRGTVFEVDPRGGWQADAKHVFVPAGLIDLALTLSIEGDARQPILRLAQGTPDSGTAKSFPNDRRSALLRTERYVDPDFSTEPVQWTVDANFGSVEIESLRLEGKFVSGGQEINGLAISGEVDTRQFGHWGKAHPLANACEDIARLGGECRPCRGTKKTCIAFRYENLSAKRVEETPMSLRPSGVRR